MLDQTASESMVLKNVHIHRNENKCKIIKYLKIELLLIAIISSTYYQYDCSLSRTLGKRNCRLAKIAILRERSVYARIMKDPYTAERVRDRCSSN
jgi:hypothetical protein